MTDAVVDHIATVYAENSPARIYFLILYNLFAEFLDDISEDVLPNDLTGYQETPVWKSLYNFQRDAATGIINKLETYNGCILADSVGLGKTFTALAVIKYYELRNKSVLVLAPKKLVGQLDELQRQPDDQHLRQRPVQLRRARSHRPLAHARGVDGAPARPDQLGQLRPRRDRRVAQLPQRRLRRGEGVPLPAADAPGHPRGRQDQGPDALGDAGQQPVQRPEEPAPARLRGGVGEPRPAPQPVDHGREGLQRRPARLQRVVEAAARGPNHRRRSSRCSTSTSSSCWTR